MGEPGVRRTRRCCARERGRCSSRHGARRLDGRRLAAMARRARRGQCNRMGRRSSAEPSRPPSYHDEHVLHGPARSRQLTHRACRPDRRRVARSIRSSDVGATNRSTRSARARRLGTRRSGGAGRSGRARSERHALRGTGPRRGRRRTALHSRSAEPARHILRRDRRHRDRAARRIVWPRRLHSARRRECRHRRGS